MHNIEINEILNEELRKNSPNIQKVAAVLRSTPTVRGRVYDMRSFLDYWREFGRLHYEIANKVYRLDKRNELGASEALEPFFRTLDCSKGKADFVEAIVSSNDCRSFILLTAAYIANSAGISNESGRIYPFIFTFFDERNSYKFFNVSIKRTTLKRIVAKSRELGLSKENVNTLSKNLRKKEAQPRKSFLKQLKHIVLSKQLFNFLETKTLPKCKTAEERALLEMSSISIIDGEIIPKIAGQGWKIPDDEAWNHSFCEMLSNYFKSEWADCIIETIDYIKNAEAPSEKTQLLLSENVKLFFKSHNCQIGNVACILGKMKRDKKLGPVANKLYKNDIQPIAEKKRNYHFQKRLLESGLPVGDKGNHRLKTHGETIYKEAINATEPNRFYTLIEEPDLANSIGEIRFRRLSQKGFTLLEKAKGIELASHYISFASFLSLCSKNPRIDGARINGNVIQLTTEWKKTGYSASRASLKSFYTQQYISSSKRNEINEKTLSDARNFGFLALPQSEWFFLKIAKDTVDDTIRFFRGIIIDESFPYVLQEPIDDYSDKINRHFETLLEKCNPAYDLLLPKDCVRTYYDFCKEQLNVSLSIFSETKGLYEKLKSLRPEIKFPAWDDEPSYSFTNSLFPILENEILRNGEKNNIPALKIDGKLTSKGRSTKKEPSTILLKRFDLNAKRFGGLFECSDLVALYLMMYSPNGLNIRNIMVHGDYYPLSIPSLEINRKATLISLAIAVARNETE